VKFVHIVVFSPVRVFIQNAIICSIFLFAFKVGDAGPILDMFAVVLETISTNVVLSRTTASAILRAAHIVSVVPNVSYHKKVNEFFYCNFCFVFDYGSSYYVLTELLWSVPGISGCLVSPTAPCDVPCRLYD